MITLHLTYRWKTDRPGCVYHLTFPDPRTKFAGMAPAHQLVRFMREMFAGTGNVEIRRVWEEVA